MPLVGHSVGARSCRRQCCRAESWRPASHLRRARSLLAWRTRLNVNAHSGRGPKIRPRPRRLADDRPRLRLASVARSRLDNHAVSGCTQPFLQKCLAFRVFDTNEIWHHDWLLSSIRRATVGRPGRRVRFLDDATSVRSEVPVKVFSHLRRRRLGGRGFAREGVALNAPGAVARAGRRSPCGFASIACTALVSEGGWRRRRRRGLPVGIRATAASGQCDARQQQTNESSGHGQERRRNALATDAVLERPACSISNDGTVRSCRKPCMLRACLGHCPHDVERSSRAGLLPVLREA